MKFGRIKRQHGRVGGLDELLDYIIKNCPHVSRIVPGRIKVRRGKTPPNFKIQYPTEAGLKCLYTGTGTVQEVFLICSDAPLTVRWLVAEEMVDASSLPPPPDEEGRHSP
ncbi:MAG TPA: DUF2103 domain-containing protein [Tepidisphaeraceae bacterium]|jgi:hypothetical protein|nr:DUF2103 domain-containing protein [Tepidisphaeraceae bacterium]